MPAGRVPLPLLIAFGLFLVVVAYLVVSPFAQRDILEFALSSRPPRDAPPAGLVTDTVTVDASDERAWRFFDFATGVATQVPDTAGWDLAFRRFAIIAAGAVADLGAVPFADVRLVPEVGYVGTAWGRDTANVAIARWYDYDFFAHLLEPRGHVYAVRTRDGHYAKVRLLSYYCTGTRPGCVTFRYAYQGDGSRQVE